MLEAFLILPLGAQSPALNFSFIAALQNSGCRGEITVKELYLDLSVLKMLLTQSAVELFQKRSNCICACN